MTRVSLYEIPNTDCKCPLPCSYRKKGWCDTPRTNKGNSDAACHRMPNKKLLVMLKEAE